VNSDLIIPLLSLFTDWSMNVSSIVCLYVFLCDNSVQTKVMYKFSPRDDIEVNL